MSEGVFLLAMITFAIYVTFEGSVGDNKEGILLIKILGWAITILFVINLFLELVS
jgi:hypothetical protein